MEFSFENKCTVDQQMMTESVRSNRKVFVTLSRIPVAITGLGIVSILARAAIQAYLDLPMLLRWTIFFLLFLRIATTPRRTARRVIKNFKSMYKVDSVEATTQFGDKIVYTLQFQTRAETAGEYLSLGDQRADVFLGHCAAEQVVFQKRLVTHGAAFF